nr:unnamed protein product [Digitaria exilis]
MRSSLVTRCAPEEKATTESRSCGPRLSMTNPMACFRSASFSPLMLPLTSSTVTRSRGARGASPASIIPGALTCTRTAKLSSDEPLATAEYSVCVFTAKDPPDAADCRWPASWPEGGGSTTWSSSSNTSGSAGWNGGCTWWCIGRCLIGDGWTWCMGSCGGTTGCCGGGGNGCGGRSNGSSRHWELQSGQTRWPCATLAEMQWKWKVWEHSAVKMACPPPAPIQE